MALLCLMMPGAMGYIDKSRQAPFFEKLGNRLVRDQLV
jgi:hypothetical protein